MANALESRRNLFRWVPGRCRRLAALGVLSVTVLGCAGATGVGSGGGALQPRILSANERSVSVEIMLLHNEADALLVADEHCRQYNRNAVLVQDRGGGKFNYECVE